MFLRLKFEFFKHLIVWIFANCYPLENLLLNISIFAALHTGLYRTYGVMMAVALVHGGVLPSFFSERLYQNLCCTPTSQPTLEEVADQDLQLKLK